MAAVVNARTYEAVMSASRDAAPYPGFLATSLLTLGIVAFGLGADLSAIGWLGLVLTAALMGSAYLGQRTRPVMTAVGFASAGMIATGLARAGVFGEPVEVLPAVAGTSFVIAIVAMLSAFRLKPIYYLVFSFAVAILVFAVSGSSGHALTASLFTAVALACCNYIVQFVFDHYYEFRDILRDLDRDTLTRVIRRVAILWVPVLFLAWGGVLLNAAIQEEIKRSVYQDWDVLHIAPEAAEAYAERNLREDALSTVAIRRNESLRASKLEIAAAYKNGDIALSQLPEKTTQIIEAARPGRIPREPCNKASFLFEIRWSPDIRLSLGPLCRRMISTVDNGVQRSFNKVKLQARESVIATAAKAKNASEQSSTLLVETVEEAIQAAFDGIDQTVRSMFGVLVLLEAVSNVVLLGGLVGALAMILGRVLFDARAKDLKKLHAFSLSKGSASKLDFCVLDEVRLNDKALAGSDKGWHIFTLASRHGEGTHLILAVPQPTSSLFQRIFTNRLLMTCVDTNAEQVRDADKGHAPTISSPGDLQFVCIGVRPGQAITFKMGDLFGFTANVHLRSVYTTHVGANLLGLGTFYSVAYVESEDAAMGSDTSGEPGSAIGTIILRSDGNRIGCADAKQQLAAGGLLAWDRRTKFAVKQELGLVGVWLVPPDIQVQDEAAAIYDEGIEARAPILHNLWRMLRYLFLPF